MHVPSHQAAQLLDGVRTGRASDTLGAPLGVPVLLVELDDDTAGVDLRLPPGWPCVVVAFSSSPTAPPAPVGPDVLLSAAMDAPAPWVGVGSGVVEVAHALGAAVRRNPQAATTLAQVLRIGATLDPAEALVVESLAYSTLQAGPEHRQWLTDHPDRRADRRTDPAVVMDRRGDALWLTLDRPERRNAFSARMRDDLVGALQLAGLDPSLDAVHLQGNGPTFCSGGDLGEFGTLADPATAHGIRTARSAGWWIDRLAERIIVHLRGTCVGAGIELAAFAGTVEATSGTTLVLPEVGMGLVPGAGGTASIPRRIGPARTAWLALTGTPLDAVTAQRWGLIDRVVDEVGQPGP